MYLSDKPNVKTQCYFTIPWWSIDTHRVSHYDSGQSALCQCRMVITLHKQDNVEWLFILHYKSLDFVGDTQLAIMASSVYFAITCTRDQHGNVALNTEACIKNVAFMSDFLNVYCYCYCGKKQINRYSIYHRMLSYCLYKTKLPLKNTLLKAQSVSWKPTLNMENMNTKKHCPIIFVSNGLPSYIGCLRYNVKTKLIQWISPLFFILLERTRIQ